MFGFRSRADRAQDEYHEMHERARNDKVVLHQLLTVAKTNDARPWLISENDDYRYCFRELQIRHQRAIPVHYSLRAHYERMWEAALDALLRFTDPSVVTTAAELKSAVAALLDGYKKLDKINAGAWAQDNAAADTSGVVRDLLSNAQRTVEDRSYTT